jgi:hypothetical protein
LSIILTCACGRALEVGDEHAGQEGTCPTCGRVMQIPGQANGQVTDKAPRPRPAKPAPWLAPPRRESSDDPEVADARLMTHAGLAIAEDDDFFVDAPPAIGQIVSAHTTLKKHVRPKSLLKIVMVASGLFLADMMVVTALFFLWRNGPRAANGNEAQVLILISAVVGIGSFALLIWWMRFVHTCTYVGKDGIAIFQCSFHRGNLLRSEVLLFEDAAELRTIPTRAFAGGIIGVSEFAYTWLDPQQAVIYRFIARHWNSRSARIDEDYHFALMAERAWTEHLARDLEQISADRELLYFPLQHGDFLQVGKGRLILNQGGQIMELPAARIAKVAAGQNLITIHEVGADPNLHAGPGIHLIGRHDLANVQFFLAALEKLLGVRI